MLDGATSDKKLAPCHPTYHNGAPRQGPTKNDTLQDCHLDRAKPKRHHPKPQLPTFSRLSWIERQRWAKRVGKIRAGLVMIHPPGARNLSLRALHANPTGRGCRRWTPPPGELDCFESRRNAS